MKHLLKITLAFILLFAASSAKAQDCSSQVDNLCNAYDQISDQISQLPDVQQLMGFDFMGQINKAHDSVDKDCYSYELTDADRDKLYKSVSGIFNSMITKVNDLTGGTVTDMIKGQLLPILDEFHDTLPSTKTLGDYLSSFN